ncbi:hypothetical protein J6590_013598 [Homalodisca vitripennis]|nr:hypothetical protein J6590_013598 [Homalodisca vitripennis]
MCNGNGVPEPTVLWRREDLQSIVLPTEAITEKQEVTILWRREDSQSIVLRTETTREKQVLWRREDSQSIVLPTEAITEKQGSKCVMGVKHRSQQSSGDERTHRVSSFELSHQRETGTGANSPLEMRGLTEYRPSN